MYREGISRSGMSGRCSGRATIAIVLIMALFMVYEGYFLHIDVSVHEARKYLPGPLDKEVERMLLNVPPEKRDMITVPLPEVVFQGDAYYDRVVTPGELESTSWILNNTDKGDKFVADIFGAELIMGMTTRVSTVGGDWANAPDPIGKMVNTTEIYKTDSALEAHDLARMENVDFIFVPHRALYTGWRVPEYEVSYAKFDNPVYFEKLYSNDDVAIYRVI